MIKNEYTGEPIDSDLQALVDKYWPESLESKYKFKCYHEVPPQSDPWVITADSRIKR